MSTTAAATQPRPAGATWLAIDAVLLQKTAEAAPLLAGAPRRERDIAGTLGQRPAHEAAFEVGQRLRARTLEGSGHAGLGLRLQVRDRAFERAERIGRQRQAFAFRQQEHALHHAGQFAQVAGPGISIEPAQRTLVEATGCAAVFLDRPLRKLSKSGFTSPARSRNGGNRTGTRVHR